MLDTTKHATFFSIYLVLLFILALWAKGAYMQQWFVTFQKDLFNADTTLLPKGENIVDKQVTTMAQNHVHANNHYQH